MAWRQHWRREEISALEFPQGGDCSCLEQRMLLCRAVSWSSMKRLWIEREAQSNHATGTDVQSFQIKSRLFSLGNEYNSIVPLHIKLVNTDRKLNVMEIGFIL